MKTRTYESFDFRDEIAAHAARLIYDEGIRDYGLAKRKAVKQLGLPARTMLPSNEAVDAALQRFVAECIEAQDLAERLTAMRRVALKLLEALPWPGYLVGAVADGVAGPFSEIEIDLFAESGKEVEIALLNAERRFRAFIPRLGATKQRPELELVLEDEPYPVRLRIWPHGALYQRKRDERGLSRAALQTLLRENANDED